MIYEGGLTFDSEQPSKFLKIPNHIAAHKFGTVLDRLDLYKPMSTALSTLSATGALDRVLSGYLRLMRHDVGAFRKSEGDHRDRLCAVMFDNPTLTVSAEFKVVKVCITHQLQLAATDMHAGLWTAWVSRLAY
jgi:hypothetical protein